MATKVGRRFAKRVQRQQTQRSNNSRRTYKKVEKRRQREQEQGTGIPRGKPLPEIIEENNDG